VIGVVTALAFRELSLGAAATATFACLIANQIGYLAGAFWIRRARGDPYSLSSDERSDDRRDDNLY